MPDFRKRTLLLLCGSLFLWAACCSYLCAQDRNSASANTELPNEKSAVNTIVPHSGLKAAHQKSESEKFLATLLQSQVGASSPAGALPLKSRQIDSPNNGRNGFEFSQLPELEVSQPQPRKQPTAGNVWQRAYQASWPQVDERGAITIASDQTLVIDGVHQIRQVQFGNSHSATELPSVEEPSANERYSLGELGSATSRDFSPPATLAKPDREVSSMSSGRSAGDQGGHEPGEGRGGTFELPQDRFAENSSLLKSTSTKLSTVEASRRSNATATGVSRSLPAVAKTSQPENTISTTQFRLAEQPVLGAHYKDETPTIDNRAMHTSPMSSDFGADPIYDQVAYDPYSQMAVYEGKNLYANQRPLVELGRPWYQLGPLPEPNTWFGFHNPATPQFIVYGDARTAVASNQFGTFSETSIATELNLNLHLQLTGTERFHATITPLDDGVKNNRYLLDEDRKDEELDFDFDAGYFEGDLGAIIGGWTGETLPFDLPFAVGVMPLLVQNGIWMEDAFLGAAATIPARNSPGLNISNMDVTFFAGFDEIISPAFEFEDDAAKMYGVLAFVEANNGYWEIDYAFLEDRRFRDRSYHNIGLAFTRRYGRFLSNSTRVIINAGQSTVAGPNTADGVLFLSENSLITGAPSTLVPYVNFFAGFDRPQSAARNAAAGGVLRNTGILFETDGMTNYPTLDPTANDTFGVAAGINLLASDFSQQLVVELAALGVIDDDPNRNAFGDQYGLGVRYQLPLNNALILRADAMIGFLRGTEDINGARIELRHKF